MAWCGKWWNGNLDDNNNIEDANQKKERKKKRANDNNKKKVKKIVAKHTMILLMLPKLESEWEKTIAGNMNLHLDEGKCDPLDSSE